MAEAEQIEPIDDAAAAAQAAEAAEAQAKADQTPEGEDQQTDQTPRRPEVVPTKVFLHRVGEETNKRRAAEERANAAQREASEYKALLDRLQKGDKGQDQQPAPQPGPQYNRDDVRAEAAMMLFQQDTNAVKNAGMADFPDFTSNLTVLNAVGATDDVFVMDLLAVDKANAHMILHWLAQDENIERAASLAGMDSRSRIAELTRISDKMSTKKAAVDAAEPPKPAPKISGAPKPRPALDGLSPAEEGEEYSDKLSDDQWSRNWNKKFAKKTA